MTSPQPLVPNYSSLPPAGRRPWAISEMIAWALVLVLAAVAAVSAAMEQSKQAASPAKEEMFAFTSQYMVGMHEMSKGGSMAGGTTDAQLIKQLEEAAKSPEDRVRLAIVSGEILGRDEAVKRLDALTDPETVDDAATAKSILKDDGPPVDDLHAFHKKYEWFADLAQSVGKPAQDPLRVVTLEAASRTLWMTVGFLIGGLGAMVVGLGLLILAIVLVLTGKIKTAFRRSPTPGEVPADRRAYLQGFAWYMTGLLGFSLVLHYVVKFTLHSASPAVGAATEFTGLGLAFAVGVSWPLLMGQSAAQWRAALGLHTGRGFFREVGSGILGYFAGLPVMAAGFIATLILIKVSGLSASHPINDALTLGMGWLVLIFVLASVWAPVTEELMFRGALFAHLRERFGWWISAPIVAVVFAIIHPQGWVALPVLASLAVVFAGIREWRGSIIGCMTAHALHNTLTLALALVVMRGM